MESILATSARLLRYETLLPVTPSALLLPFLLSTFLPSSANATPSFQTVCTEPYSDSTPGSINEA